MNVLMNEIRRIVDDAFTKGQTILVWYDEDGALSEVLPQAIPQDVSFVKYDGSYIKIREIVETEDPELEARWVIYVSESPQRPSWIKDYETIIGCKIEHTLGKVLAERFGLKLDPEIKRLLAGQGGRLLAAKWTEVMEATHPPIAREQVVRGLLASAFNLGAHFTIGRAILEYVSFPEKYQGEMEKLRLHEAFAETIRKEMELLTLSMTAPVDPGRLAAAILLSELVVRSNGLGAREFGHLLPSEERRKQWVQLADEWRSDSRLNQSFKGWSEKLAKQYDVKGKLAGLEIADVQSFAAVDEVLFDEVCSRLAGRGTEALAAQSKTILAIAEVRMRSFWIDTLPGKNWRAIGSAIRLLTGCNEASVALRSMEGKDIDRRIESYVADEGWWKLDELHIELSGELAEDERVNRIFIEPAITAYAEWLNELNMDFSEVASLLSKWPPSGMRSQLDFWNTAIRSGAEAKVALFLVDALRFDLCKQLAQKLKALGSDVKIEPMVASVPSVTEVGMASLMPLDGKRLELNVENQQLRVSIGGFNVTNRSEREKWLRSQLGSELSTVDMDDVLRGRLDELRSLIERTRYLVVAHQEIDAAGALRPEITTTFFKDIIQRLARAVLKLHEAGARRIVVGTDHGFLVYPSVWKIGLIEDIPAGARLARGRRYVVGHPPRSEALITFPISSTGLLGDGYIGVPRGLSMVSMRGELPRYVHGGLSPQEVCIVFLTSTYERARVVRVKLDIVDPITSKIFFANVSPIESTPSEQAVTVKVKILFQGETIGESEPITVHLEPRRIRLELAKIVASVELQLIDIKTEEALDVKTVGVQLSGYDDLL